MEMFTGILPVVKVVDNFDAEYEYITNEGTVFTFKTNLKSPHYKLINIDFANYKQVGPTFTHNTVLNVIF